MLQFVFVYCQNRVKMFMHFYLFFRLFDWRPDKPLGTRARWERIVILKNVFDPKMIEVRNMWNYYTGDGDIDLIRWLTNKILFIVWLLVCCLWERQLVSARYNIYPVVYGSYMFQGMIWEWLFKSPRNYNLSEDILEVEFNTETSFLRPNAEVLVKNSSHSAVLIKCTLLFCLKSRRDCAFCRRSFSKIQLTGEIRKSLSLEYFTSSLMT